MELKTIVKICIFNLNKSNKLRKINTAIKCNINDLKLTGKLNAYSVFEINLLQFIIK